MININKSNGNKNTIKKLFKFKKNLKSKVIIGLT